MPRTFEHFTSYQVHAQREAKSAKSLVAFWNMPKLVLQTLGKLAIRLQALDRKLNVPRSFGHFRADQAHAQGEAQSAEKFLALWNRTKVVLETLGKLAIRFQALDRKLNVPRTFGHFRSDHACGEGGPECKKFPGTLESAQTSSADPGQAGDSLATVRSQTKCAPCRFGWKRYIAN